MSQLELGVLPLVTLKSPPVPDRIDLRCCGADDLLASGVSGAYLVHADPPWTYARLMGQADPSAIYPTLDYATIADHLSVAAHMARPGARLVEWQTFPLLDEIAAAKPRVGWRYVTGGAWVKTDHHGPGHHWSGIAEIVRVYTRPGRGWRDTSVPLRNGWMSPPEQHSAKPVEWLEQMVRRWVPPGGLVVELYAGLGSMARAVLRAGEDRRYIGCEIDPERHAGAIALLAQERV